MDAVGLRGVLLTVALLLYAAAPARADALRWGDPVPVDTVRPPGHVYGVTAAACPAAGLCVALDQQGNAYVTADPEGGRDAWSVSAIDRGELLWDLSCPSATLCVAVDEAGNVLTTRDPLGGDWEKRAVAGNRLRNVECPTTTRCFATDSDRHVWTTSDPTGTWTSFDVTFEILGLACPSASLCVAAAGTFALVSTDPAGGAAAWQRVSKPDMPQWFDVTCPSTTLCLVAGQGDHYAYSTDPAGGADAWSVLGLGARAGFWVSCPSTTRCYAGDGEGNQFTASDPGAGRAAWTEGPIAGGEPIGPPRCLSDDLCIATDRDGVAIRSHGAWTATSFDGLGYAGLTGAACPSVSLCVAVDDAGAILSSTDPTGGPAAWHKEPVAGSALLAVACPATTLCVAGDADGDVVTGRPGDWHVATADPGNAIFAVSCPATTFCAALDDAGRVLDAGDPVHGPWRVRPVDPANVLTAISCGAPATCVAVDDAGDALTTTDMRAWSTLRVDQGAPLLSVACPSASLCVAGDADGGIVRSAAAFEGTWRWRPWPQAAADALTAAACPSVSLCLVGDRSGNVLASTDPAGDEPWEHDGFPQPVSALACASASLCLAVDSLGSLRAATGDAPYATAPPQVTGEGQPGATLACSPGQWTGATGFTYHWRAGDNELPHETAPTYTIPRERDGSPLSCWVTATGPGGTATAATAPLATTLPPVLAGGVRVGGTPTAGYAVTCLAGFGGWPPIEVTYQWLRDGAPIAQGYAYVATAADVGHALQCVATATNDWGSTRAVSPAAIVAAPAPPIAPTLRLPGIKVHAVTPAKLLRSGLPVTVSCPSRCTVTLQLRVSRATARAHRLPSVVLARRRVTTGATRTVHVRPPASIRRRLKGARRLKVTVRAREATLGSLPSATVTLRVSRR